MRDIATLKERVDFAERHLKATETARNRESEALMETWRKVRERFIHQEGEIARFRAEVEALTTSNELLSRMVDDLIAIIDGNIERGRDETVPQIATLAGDLLASEPSADDLSHFAEDMPDVPEVPEMPEQSARDALADREPDIDASRSEGLIDLDRARLDIPSSDGAALNGTEESLSPGIRSLIQRVESSVGEPDRLSVEPDDEHGGGDGDGDVDEDLARELQEIEMLRSELSGLRDRITAGDA